MDRLNILVLHSLGCPNHVPNFLLHHVFSLRNNFSEHNYLYHDTALPLPGYVADTVFDAIILDVTLLCARWSSPDHFEKIKNSYKFIKDSNAIKIAFPQDEYDCNELLDEWMCEWSVDIVFSVISSNWDILYPSYHKAGEIILGYTGYVDESLICMERKSFHERTIDVGYRARKLPPYFGRIGETKWTIGRDFGSKSKKVGLKTDIVTGEKSVLLGKSWLDFINKCKFTLGSNSGSSLLDPRGKIQRQVRAYLQKHPDAAFEEVEELFFKGLEGHYSFTAISPRILEAALLESCQILVEGTYSGIIQPWEHYIPVKNDASDFDDVYLAMQDTRLVDKLINNCRSAILDVEDLRYKNKAKKIIELIAERVSNRKINSRNDLVNKVKLQYERDMAKKYSAYWKRQKIHRNVRSLIEDYPFLLRIARSARNIVARV